MAKVGAPVLAQQDPKNKVKKGKRYTKKPKRDKSHVHRDHPRCRSAMWICVSGHTPT